MHTQKHILHKAAAAGLAALIVTSVVHAQPAAEAPRARGAQRPQVTSPEISAERKITFRILAPRAGAIRLSAGDIPGMGQGKEMTKGSNGVWEVTVGPVDPGAYRYNF